MRVFLDIGGHLGETLDVVVDPDFRFERIVSFEPAPQCWPALEARRDDRLEVCRFGLWHEDAEITLNNPGDVGASVAADKDKVAESAVCEFRDAAEWFATNISQDDEVFAKINVEGAEHEVVGRLASTSQLRKIDHLLIHLDVRKSPSRAHLAYEISTWLDAAGVEYLTAEQILFRGVLRGTRNWLRWCEADPWTRDLRFRKMRSVEQVGRNLLYPLKVRALERATTLQKRSR